jgi:hypothetical protein
LGRVLNEPQLHFLATVGELVKVQRPVRIVVLKARQLGLSTVIEAILFQLSLTLQRTNALVISHDKESARHLLGMTKHYWDTYWARQLYSLASDNRDGLTFSHNDSSLTVGTAGNVSTGRSFTYQMIHASEVAFWGNARTLMTGLHQTLPDHPMTFSFIESTAHGVGGYYYDTYQAAASGDSEYIPLFYPWFTVSKYSHPGAPHIPDYRLDSEERILRKIGVSNAHLAWRRWAIVNKTNGSLDDFHQEYPSSAEEAFITSGTNVFPKGDLEIVYQPIEPERGVLDRPPGSNTVHFKVDPHAYAENQPLRVYRRPQPNAAYIIAGDPTRTLTGDFATIQVIDRRTLEQVAQWRGRVDPSTFGDKLIELAMFYNWGLVTTEINGPGSATIQRIMTREYPNVWQDQKAERDPGTLGHNYGWHSSTMRKSEAVGHLLRVITEHDLILHDPDALRELTNYVSLGQGQFGNNDDEKYDDLVMSLAIAITCLLYDASTLPALPPGARAENNYQPIDPMRPAPRNMEVAGNQLILPDSNPDEPPWERWERESAMQGGDYDPNL